MPAIKHEPQDELVESMETQTVLVKEEENIEFEESPLINQIIFPIESNSTDDKSIQLNVTCDTSAQTDDTVQMEESIPDSRLEQEEIEKTKVYRKKIKTLQQQIRRQDKLIQNLEDKIAEIRNKCN